MFKTVRDKVWVFDAEWVPDPVTGRLLYKLEHDMPDEEVLRVMWQEGGATVEDEMPYLKTVLCRVVSISAVIRTVTSTGVKLQLLSLPHNVADPAQTSESSILESFLTAVGKNQPQLIGYNSHSADLKIMVQRGIVSGIQTPDFCRRPGKPWEGVDYFARGSEWNIDLLEVVGGWGKSAPSLNEIVTACGIPGKISVDGNQVALLWLKGELGKIVAYNEFDALTTYLLWLRMAHFAGFVSSDNYQEEQALLRNLLVREADTVERSHLQDYLAEWDRLRAAVESGRGGGA